MSKGRVQSPLFTGSCVLVHAHITWGVWKWAVLVSAHIFHFERHSTCPRLGDTILHLARRFNYFHHIHMWHEVPSCCYAGVTPVHLWTSSPNEMKWRWNRPRKPQLCPFLPHSTQFLSYSIYFLPVISLWTCWCCYEVLGLHLLYSDWYLKQTYISIFIQSTKLKFGSVFCWIIMKFLLSEFRLLEALLKIPAYYPPTMIAVC